MTRVLIVVDRPDELSLVRTLLEDQGGEVAEAPWKGHNRLGSIPMVVYAGNQKAPPNGQTALNSACGK